MIEINEIGEVVNFYPFNRFAGFVISFSIRVPSCILIQLLDLIVCIYSGSIISNDWLSCIFFYSHVAIHTNIYRRNGSMFTILGTTMTIQTTDLVYSGMHFMRIINWLYRLIPLLSSQSHCTFYQPITCKNEKYNGK